MRPSVLFCLQVGDKSDISCAPTEAMNFRLVNPDNGRQIGDMVVIRDRPEKITPSIFINPAIGRQVGYR